MENPFDPIEKRLIVIEEKLDSLINEIENPDKNRNLSPTWMTSKQLMQYLGISSSVLASLRLNKIPYYRIGGKILYKKQEIDDLIEKSRQKSGNEYLNDFLISQQGKDRLNKSKF
jgi:hypothetical protein